MSVYYDCIYRDENPKEVSTKTCIQSWSKFPSNSEIVDHNFQMHNLRLIILSHHYLKHYVKINTMKCVDCCVLECLKCGYCHTENCNARIIKNTNR